MDIPVYPCKAFEVVHGIHQNKKGYLMFKSDKTSKDTRRVLATEIHYGKNTNPWRYLQVVFLTYYKDGGMNLSKGQWAVGVNRKGF